MPNAKLPSALKQLASISACLMTDTEEIVREKFAARLRQWEEQQSKYDAAASAYIADFSQHNPYLEWSRRSWRNQQNPRQPTLANREKPSWREAVYYPTEEAALVHDQHCAVRRDWVILLRAFPHWEVLFGHYERDFDRQRIIDQCNDDELLVLDGMHYRAARDAYLTKDAEWIEETALRNEHVRAHTPPAKLAYWQEMLLSGADKAYQEGVQDYEERLRAHKEKPCKFCDLNAEREAALAIQPPPQPSTPSASEETATPEPPVSASPRPVQRFDCELCQQTFRERSSYEAHCRSKPHVKKEAEKKREQFHCQACEIQCRTEYEWTNHIQTSKHKKKVAGDGSRKCEACDVFCRSASVWDAHVQTAKHLKKIAEA